MSDPQRQYWIEFVAEVLDEHGLTATSEQCELIARDFSNARGEIGQCVPGPGGYSPGPAGESEADRLLKELQKEREKRGCTHCKGAGSWQVPVGASHWSTETCPKCGGSGKV